MSESRTVDYRVWDGATSDELGYTGPHLHTQLYRYTSEKRQTFNVLAVDARPHGVGPTILSSPSFDYRIDQPFIERASIYATHRQALFVASEVPGVTSEPNGLPLSGDFQTLDQIIPAFVRGDFTSLAVEQLRAIDRIIGLSDGQNIELFGESLGTHYVTAMARAIAERKFDRDLTISRMDLIEPVNSYGHLSLMGLYRLSHNLRHIEARLLPRYQEENEEIGHGNAQPIDEKIDQLLKSRQRISSNVTSFGVHTGLHVAILRALRDHRTGLRNADIRIARGIHSTVSPKKSSSRLVDAIREVGGHARLESLTAGARDLTKLGHNFLNSYGRLAEYVAA